MLDNITLQQLAQHHAQANDLLSQIWLDQTYQYAILDRSHAKRVVSMFTQVFCDSEPMTKYVDMDYASFTVFATAVVDKAIADGLSIVALDGERVIACALVEDIADPVVFEVQLTEKFKYIFSLLEHLTGKFLNGKKFPKHHLAHLFITAVNEDYRGKGLSEQVNFRAMALAASQDFAFMMSELTNHINENGIMHHLQYDKLLLNAQVYQVYEADGIKPFANLAGSATGYLWALHKNALLMYEENGSQQVRALKSF